MKAIDRPFTRLINGNTQFVIPVFQRDYSWTEENCKQLWNDLMRVGGAADSRVHFVGSVVYIPSGDSAAGFTRWLLIDGQQRLTTVTLLLLALRDHLLETNWQGEKEDDPTPKRIDAYFLKNIQEEGARQQKLVLRRNDQRVLRALLERAPIAADDDSRVLENYQFFREKVASADPSIIYRGVDRLIIVDVALDRGSDDPQMIFESLNSTGLDLSQADLIRNFILMRMSEKEQTRLYESYWRNIEDSFRSAARTFDLFARDYMGLGKQSAKLARADSVYYEFRDFFRDREQAIGADALLDDMQRHARHYAAFAGTAPIAGRLGLALKRLNQLAEVAAILVMRLFHCHERAQTLSERDFISSLEMLESYIFRRAVCGLQTRGYNQVFVSLAQRIRESDPLDSLKQGLVALSESYRFPSDEEFLAELTRRDVYSMRNCHYMLDRIENYDTKEPTDTSAYTIEHVLPQNERLNRQWKEMLGPQFKDIQATWVHRLGNLTLTGYNSTYSDRPFEEKKSIKGGFNESAVRLNKYIRDQERWTAAEIESRGKLLADIAAKAWPPLRVSAEELKQVRRAYLQREAGQMQLAQIAMESQVKQLFDALRPHLLALAPDIIEVPRSSSISYYAHDGDYFVEAIPRRRRLTLLLNLSLSECTHRDEDMSDATDWKFIVNAEHDGGVVYRLKAPNQIDAVMKLIRQAHELAAQ